MSDVEIPNEQTPAPRGRDFDAARLVTITPRTDGARIGGGDTIMGDPSTGTATSRPEALILNEKGPAPAAPYATRIVGDMVSGMPRVERNTVQPCSAPIERGAPRRQT